MPSKSMTLGLNLTFRRSASSRDRVFGVFSFVGVFPSFLGVFFFGVVVFFSGVVTDIVAVVFLVGLSKSGSAFYSVVANL